MGEGSLGFAVVDSTVNPNEPEQINCIKDILIQFRYQLLQLIVRG
jgi:hypothetical protein